jgi:hypothetical protein
MVNNIPMAKKRKLKSVGEVVEALGGTKATAEWCDIGMSAVSNWIAAEYIPPGWHYRMTAKLGERGIEIDPAVFGMHLDREPPPKKAAERRVA